MKNYSALKFLFVIVLLSTSTIVRAQTELPVIWQVLQYDLTANLPAQPATERALTGHAALSVRNVGQGVGRTFTVRLNPAAEVQAAKAGDTNANFVKRDDPRAKLQQVTLTLPTPIQPGGTLSVTIDYRLPLAENSGIASISTEAAQFLPLSGWYPTPNSALSVRGVDTAPMRLTVNAPGGEMIVSTGQANGTTFDQKLNVQPFFLTGKWETLEGANDARGISAWLYAGASADERKHAESYIALAAAARSYYASVLGVAPDAPVRLAAVRRGAGFDMGGTVLLDAAAFRRSKVDAITALLIAESVAHLWIGGATAVGHEGAGVVREGLTRYLAQLFLEKQFGREAADAGRLRERIAYSAIAKRDPPLAKATQLDPTYYTSVSDKGAMVWRLVERMLGREAFLSIVRAQLQTAQGSELTLDGLRAALNERGGANIKSLLDYELDQLTDLDLLIGLPQQRGGEWVSALRNLGGLNVSVPVAATTASGERITTEASIPARDFGEAHFKTTAKIVRAEIDPDKLYPQIDYANDIVPHAPALEESLDEATRLLAGQDYARAESIARDLLQRAPLFSDARILLARTLLEENKLDQAEHEFRAALDERLPLPSTLAWGNIGLGEIELKRGQTAEAAKFFDEAVRADAGYAQALAARSGRVKAEAALGAAAPKPDAAIVAAITQLDQAIRSGRKAELDALIVPGELVKFSKGIVGSQPEQWQTRVLRTEIIDAGRVAADVNITAKVLGKDQSGDAVLIFARVGNALRLVEIPIFEVR